MIKRKPNIVLLVTGIFAILMFAISFYYSWTGRSIRLNGELREVEITEVWRYKGGWGATIILDGNNFNAGSISHDKSVGDSILVRYIPDEYCVVQESVHPDRYYLYFTLESILLIIGIALIVESLKGKDFSYYEATAIDFKKLGNDILKWISKKLRR